eukprot:GILJ01011312.1.p1 GENE.GILJ01011312.1~~GILJ01011312.1.p1  ORF type:complete len:517 (+),score=64.62 GILJ01011312.1:145-1695(+)
MDLRRAKRTSSKAQTEAPIPQVPVTEPGVAVSSTSTSSITAVESLSLEVIQCSICFDKVSEQGILNCCSHPFCFECIHTWSKSENKCPVCKRRFENLTRKPLDLEESERPKKRRKLRSKAEDSAEDRPEVIQVPFRNQRNAYEHDMSWLEGPGFFPGFEFGFLVQMPTEEAETPIDFMPLFSNLFDTGARRASNATANSRPATRQSSRNQTRDRERQQQQQLDHLEHEFHQQGTAESDVPSNLRVVDSEDIRQRYQMRLPSNLSIGRVMVSGPESVDTTRLFRSLDSVMDTIFSTVLAGRFGLDGTGNGNSNRSATNDPFSGLADVHIQFSTLHSQLDGNRGAQEGRERIRNATTAAAPQHRRHQRQRDQTPTPTPTPTTQTSLQTSLQTSSQHSQPADTSSASERRSRARHVSSSSSGRTRHQQHQQEQQEQRQQPPGFDPSSVSFSAHSVPRSNSNSTAMSSSSSSQASSSHPSSNNPTTTNSNNNPTTNNNVNSINHRSRSRSSRRQGGQDRS